MGRGFSVSLFDGIAEWLSVPLLFHDYAGIAPQRHGLHHASIAPYGVYQVAGQVRIALAVQTEREWHGFCEAVLERPALASKEHFRTNSQRVENRVKLDAIINEVLGALSFEDVVNRLIRASLPWAPYNSIADLSSHPDLRRIAVETDNGTVSVPAPPLYWHEAPEFEPGAPPGLNAHGAALRREFGNSNLGSKLNQPLENRRVH